MVGWFIKKMWIGLSMLERRGWFKDGWLLYKEDMDWLEHARKERMVGL